MYLFKKRVPHITILVPVFWLAVSMSYSQTDSTITLKEVTVQSSRSVNFNSGKKTSELDSSILVSYIGKSIGDVLTENSHVFIKSYGPSNLATTSFRGGNANHTAILWNGFAIQNPMLGQNDLSILQSSLFESIQLEHGGAGAIWGSGAIGGAISLKNNYLFNKGTTTSLNMNVGSFDTKKINTHISFSKQRFISVSKLYYNTSENNYSYYTVDNLLQKQTNANYTLKGFLQEFYGLIGRYQKITARIWLNDALRFLPSITGSTSKAYQSDKNIKATTEWQLSKQYLKVTARIGWFRDDLNYTDSSSSIFSKSTTTNLILESDLTYTMSNQHVFYLGVNSTNIEAKTLNYQASAFQNKHALIGAYKYSSLNHKLHVSMSARKEMVQQLATIPLTYNAGVSYSIIEPITIKTSYSRVYRLPTLNDLYWFPGGNPNLQPESGHTMDVSLEAKKTIHHFLLTFEGSYFNHHIQNWIIWLPSGNTIWSPRNIAQVYSRGVETNSEIVYAKADFKWKTSLNTTYVLSTNEKAISESDNGLHKQLIYTPRYNVNGRLSVEFKKLQLTYTHSYIGYRFTTTDNLSWLPPYSIGNLKCSYTHYLASLSINHFFSINNCFNTNYQVVSNRAMPLRHFEIGLTLTHHKNKNTKI